MQVICRINLRL